MSTSQKKRTNNPKNDNPKLLSATDKKILSVLLNPDGKITTYELAKIVELPTTTVGRRRSYLEERFLDHQYTLKLGELGFRRVDLLVATEGGRSRRWQLIYSN